MIRELTLYNRYGCHLCEDMLLSLNDYASELNFEVNLVDIDEDPSLYRKYNDAVPVLSFGSQEVCRHFLDLNALRNVLNNDSSLTPQQAHLSD